MGRLHYRGAPLSFTAEGLLALNTFRRAAPAAGHKASSMGVGAGGDTLSTKDWVQVVIVAGIGTVLEWYEGQSEVLQQPADTHMLPPNP